MTDITVTQFLVALLAGFATGIVYLSLLWLGTDRLVLHGNWRAASVLAIARLAVAGAALWLAAQHGPLQMLSLFLGFLAARQLWLARIKGA